TSDDPYLLRARVTSPPAEATCPARSFANPYGAASSIPTLPADATALFLTDPGRMVATYGQAAEDALESKLNDLVTYLNGNPQLGIVPAVVPVEAYPDVQAAYAAWDANPCSVSAANGVAAQVTGVIHAIRTTSPAIAYITILGGDDILPMGRVPDLTRVSNESEYASTFVDGVNPISAAEAASDTLTDDVYGDPSPTPIGDGSSLFVPQMAVGRLVETPVDIDRQLASYQANDGTLATSTGLVAGYDFLADGSAAVASRLAAGVGGRSIDTLIDQPDSTTPWTDAQLLANLFPVGGATPLVDSINAHYDHTALLPSAGNAGTDSQLETAADIAARSSAGQLAGRVLFTMGCHAGLAVPDAYIPGASAADATLKLDWAQALSNAGVSVYVANTGYGIGDTTSVAYSERLMALYAKELDGSLTAGQALVYAKQAYYGSLGAVGVYDLKVLQQAAFYGLPFWYVGSAPVVGSKPPSAPAAPPLPGTIQTDPLSGLAALPLSLSQNFRQVTTSRGTYWVVQNPDGSTEDPQVTQYEPLQPTTSLSVVTGGQTAHGALITGLISHDVSNVNPVLSTPTIDLSASSPEVKTGDAAWPASIATITNSTAPYGRAQDVVVTPGQFIGSTTDGTGRQRLYDQVGLSVLYAPDSSTDFNPPTIATSRGDAVGTNITFTVSA
ncbi:MAG: C25 family cysteine peptidase, partial [Candidatus Limnocylindrales bacterium]